MYDITRINIIHLKVSEEGGGGGGGVGRYWNYEFEWREKNKKQ